MTRLLRGHPVVALLVILALVLVAARTQQGEVEASPGPMPSASATPPVASVGDASSTLAGLAVKGRAPRTGYSRDEFGQAWRDLDRNGCDQRNDVLRRDLVDVALEDGTHGCVVQSGTLISPYSGEAVPFLRGTTTSREVQIDHVVALSDAWQKGAQAWTPELREKLANDFLELRATDMSTNASKGAGDAATWLPPRRASWCAYVAAQIAVKHEYGLWVTAAERDAMAAVLSSCPGQGLPGRSDVPLGAGSGVAAEQL
ncbi:MAG: HNH endonuclease family protein [Aeromicrobium sp.]